ncbi:unnamed protein product [Parnassius mnemosyne]|uniref:Uncharacterized protein n=1 Tax=Parnassius mnemosyne TaxID=213953 RepID=A0AAV1LHK5_9NEOP
MPNTSNLVFKIIYQHRNKRNFYVIRVELQKITDCRSNAPSPSPSALQTYHTCVCFNVGITHDVLTIVNNLRYQQ